jgi:hypothetical protein
MRELTTEELSEFLLKVINNTGGVRRKMVALKHFVDEHTGERVGLQPFDQAKYEAGFQTIANEVDAKVLEQMIVIANKNKAI